MTVAMIPFSLKNDSALTLSEQNYAPNCFGMMSEETQGTFLDSNRSGNRLYISYQGKISLRPKTPVECLGERVLRPVIDRIDNLRRFFLKTPIVGPIVKGAWRVWDTLADFPPLLPLAVAQQAAQEPICEGGCQDKHSLSEEQLKRCARTFSMGEDASSQSCFEAAYSACQNREWDRVSSIQSFSDFLINPAGRSLLWEAAYRFDYALARELILKEIAIHTRDNFDNTAMHFAVRLGEFKLVKFLFDRNSINALNKNGQTPLHIAATYDHDQIAVYLINHGADLSAGAHFYSSL